MADNRVQVAIVIRGFGQAIRGDWGSIDGRSIRDTMNHLANYLDPDSEVLDADAFCEWEGICLKCQSWTEHCRDKGHERN